MRRSDESECGRSGGDGSGLYYIEDEGVQSSDDYRNSADVSLWTVVLKGQRHGSPDTPGLHL